MSEDRRNPGYDVTPEPGDGDRFGRQPVPVSQGAEPPAHLRDDIGYGYGVEDDEQFHLRQYLDVLLRRRWTVMAFFAAVVLSTAVFTLSTTPLFRSTTLLQIRPSGPNILSFQDVQDPIRQAQAYMDFFQTQYSILESRALAIRTIDELDLMSNATFNPALQPEGIVAGLKRRLKELLNADSEVDPELEALAERKRLVNAFLESVEIAPKRKSFLVDVAFWSPDPQLASSVASTMAREYIGLTLDQTMDSASQGRVFIEKQLARTKARLEESEVALQDYARGREIHAVEQEERMIHERLADLNSRLTEAESDRIRLEANYEQTKGADRYSIPIIVESLLISRLKEELATLEIEQAELQQTFSDEYPEVRKLGARLKILNIRIIQEQDRLIASVRADFRAANGKEKLLGAELDKQQKVVAAYEEKAIDFKIMKREVDTNRGIYENLLKRLKEVEVAEAVRASNVSIVDEAEVPLRAAHPRIPLNMALAMVIGIFGGVGIAFTQEYLDDSVKTPDDVEKAARLPTLAAIPEFMAPKLEPGEQAPSFDQEVALQPTSPGAEAVRTLRASLFLAAPGGLPTRLLVTSPRPGEGKTCTVTNLAIALAQMGRKVVLIDCDLRKPRIHAAMGIDQQPGVSGYLAGHSGLDEIIKSSGHASLDVIPAGPIPPNPVDLFDSVAMSDFLAELEKRYDHILVDAPPTLGFADVPILANRIGGGCLLVAQSGKTPARVLRGACEYLMRMQSRLLGIVLNKVSTRSAGYSYYGSYGYYGSSNYGGYYGREAEGKGRIEDRA